MQQNTALVKEKKKRKRFVQSDSKIVQIDSINQYEDNKKENCFALFKLNYLFK